MQFKKYCKLNKRLDSIARWFELKVVMSMFYEGFRLMNMDIDNFARSIEDTLENGKGNDNVVRVIDSKDNSDGKYEHVKEITGSGSPYWDGYKITLVRGYWYGDIIIAIDENTIINHVKANMFLN